MSQTMPTNKQLLEEVKHLRSRVAELETQCVSQTREASASAGPNSLTRPDHFLKLHVDHSPLGMIEWDKDFQVRYWSPRSSKIFGWSAADVIGKHWEDFSFVYDDDLQMVKDTCADLFARKVDFNTCLNRNRCKDGRVVHCRWYNSLVTDQDGNITSVLSLASDETENIRVEAALVRSEARFELAVRGLLMGVWEWEIETGKVFWSERLYRQLGYTRQEISPSFDTFFDLLHPDDRERTQLALNKSLSTGAFYENEFRIRHRSGEYRWFREKGALDFDDANVPIRMAGCLEDIQEQREAKMAAEEAQRALNESHLHQQLALDAGEIGTWNYDVQNDRVKADERMVRILGMSPKVVASGAPLIEFLDRIHVNDRDEIASIIEHALTTGGTYTAEFRVNQTGCSDQHPAQWIVARGTVALDENGNAITAPGAVVDVSDRRSAETALAAREEQLRLMFDQQFQFMAILSADGTTLEINNLALKVQGLARADCVGKPFWESPAWNGLADWRKTIKSRVMDAARQDSPVIKSDAFKAADGSTRYAEASYSAIRDVDGDVRYILVQATDVTEKIRVQKELEETKAVLSAAIEASPAGIIIAEAPDVRIRTVNAAAIGIRNASAEELTNIPYDLHPARWNCFHPDGTAYRPEDLPLSRAVLHGEVSKNVDVIIERSVGERQWVLGNAAPVRNSAGEITGGVVVFPDVTEQKNAAAALRLKESELAHVARVSTMGEMVGGIAHELNQPLYAIQNYGKASVTLLEGGTNFEREQLTEWLHQITDAAEHAGKVLVRLRDFVSRRPTDTTQVEIPDVLAAAISLTQFEAQQRKVVVRLDLPPDLPTVMADMIQIQQVVVNLVKNGIEAIPPTNLRRQIDISARNLDNSVQVSVADSGRGLPEEGIRKLFKAFSSTKPNGMGLGLAIAKTIIESHGGELWATRAPKSGAVFHFTLDAMG